MKKNDYLKIDDTIYRILAVDKDNYLVLNCNTKNMPAWRLEVELSDGVIINREEAFEILEIELIEEELTGIAFKQAHARYTMIAGVLAFMNDDSLRNRAIAKGLVVNKMRYDADGFTEEYLNGGKCTVAFNPDDAREREKMK